MVVKCDGCSLCGRTAQKLGGCFKGQSAQDKRSYLDEVGPAAGVQRHGGT
jgi:hypothetical protein